MLALVGSGLLFLLSLFMLAGFLRSGANLSSLPTLLAFSITVLLPAAGGAALAARHFRYGKRLAERRDRLRQQTLEAEVLRLAEQRAGRLTLIEIVTEMAVSSDQAQLALDGLVTRELADIAVTDSGTLVYTFRDIEKLADKSQARGILE
jgi:hypothetical protein